MTIQREVRSKRLLQRVVAPLRVTVEGQTYGAADWSMGGFGLSLPRLLEAGARIEVRLGFPVGGAEVAFETFCEVRHVRPDGRHGFRFVDLTPDQLELLRQMWIAATTGQVVPLDACLTPADPPPPMPPEQPAAPPRSWRRLLGYGVLLAIGVAVAGGLAVSFHARFLVVAAVQAAVTVPVVRVRAPVEGRMTGPALTAGQAVPAGAPLFDLGGAALASDIDLADAELVRLAGAIEALRRRRQSMQGFFTEYAALAEAGLLRAQADRGRADSALQLAERDLSRWEQLARAGYAAQARLEQAEQRYAQAEQALAAAEAAVSQAEVNLRMAHQGRWFTGSRVEGGDPAKLDDDLRQAEAAHALQSRRLAALLDRRAALVVTSPCDCVVVQALAAPDEWLTAGATAYLLRPRAGEAVLTVRVVQEKADLLAQGDRAVVRLAGAEATAAAGILEISRAPPVTGRFGLPASVPGDLATVTLRLPADVPEPAAGTPAQVLFPIPPRRLLLAWLGWTW